MKTIFALSIWLALILSVPTGVALAQDSTRVPEVSADPNASVDAAAHAEVHAGTDEQKNQEPQPLSLGQTKKRQQKGTTKWTLQPSDQAPATRFQPAQSTKPASGADAGDSKALFNPLTHTVTPPSEEADGGKSQSQTISPTKTNQPLGSKPQPDTQSAARMKMLDSLNSNTAAPGSKTWNSPVNAAPHKSTGSGALSATATQRKKPKKDSQSPLQSSLSKPGGSKSGSLNANSQKRKSSDPTLRDKPGSALDSRSSLK